ncbi:aldo/keto reductase [Methanosphaera sp.]
MNNNTILGFGAMRLPVTNEDDPTTLDTTKVQEMIDYYMDKGFNYFDTSYAYHNGASETTLRELLVKRYPRESFEIADKMPTWLLTSEEDNQKFVDEMLERLGVDYFDVFLIHNINQTLYPLAENAKTFQYIEEMKKEGIARKIGISFHDRAALLEEILEKYGDILDVVQLQLNYLDWNSTLTESKKCYELCEKYDIEVVVMEPIKGGILVNLPEQLKEKFTQYDSTKTPATMALNFAGSPKNIKVVLSGMNSIDDLKENAEVFTEFSPISSEDEEFLESIAEEYQKLIAVPCSYCGYCLKECPKQIPIADYFEYYNNYSIHPVSSISALYMQATAVKPAASECIECGKCLGICTQKINIPEKLKEVVDCFGK